MNTDGRQTHWENVYTSKGENEVSWFQESPAPSLALIAGRSVLHQHRRSSTSAAARRAWSIISSNRDFCDVTVLDLSAAALGRPPGPASANTRAQRAWLVADATDLAAIPHLRRMA